ncbi:MAG: cell envelope integrity protein TolA [bacterium]
MIVPGEVNAGEEFEVEFVVNKGYLASFARFIQELPAGLTAEAVISANANFSFNDKRVRFIWLRLPPEETFTFKYKIKVDERLKGNFVLGGKFSFIDENERRFVDLSGKTINIIPSPHIDESLLVDINEFEELVILDLAPKEEMKIVCIREKPDLSNSANEIIVRILVNKENKKKFAKIEEEIPFGYTAVGLETKDGIFTYKDQMAKFLWMNLPSEKYFVVSYKLIPNEGQQTTELEIDGTFSFIEEDRTVELDIVEREMNSSELTPVMVEKLLQSVPEMDQLKKERKPRNFTRPPVVTPPKDTIVPLADVEAEKQKQLERQREIERQREKIKQEELAKKEELLRQKEIERQKDLERKNRLAKEQANKRKGLPNLLEPEEGVYFRVQVAAGHKPVEVNQYFKRLNITDDVRTEYHNEWIKYSIGSYKFYKEARDYRVHIWNTTPVNDAFVAAYNDGERITVQEALMIANQKWAK